MNEFTYMKDREFREGRFYIGASDWATLSGINQYQTPYQFWAIWTGREKGFTGSFRSVEGHFKEAGILGKGIAMDMLIEQGIMSPNPGQWMKAISSERVNNFITSRLWGDVQFEDFHSWTEAIMPIENIRGIAGSKAADRIQGRICAHADLLNMGLKTPLITQAKNSGMMATNTRKRNPFKGYAKDDLSQNGIPLSVYLQEIGEMMCYGLPEANVEVEIDGADWRRYGPVKYRKKDAEKLLILADRMLWHIDNDKPPTPENWPDVLAQFPDFEKATKSTVSDAEELDCKNHIAQFHKCSDKIKVLQDRKLDIQMGLALHACEPDLGIMRNYLTDSAGNTLASFYEKQGQWRISYKKVSENPDLLAQCEAIGAVSQDDPTRSMSISGANAGNIDMFTLITYPDGKEGKAKKSRKKFTKDEKKLAESVVKQSGIQFEWERYSV